MNIKVKKEMNLLELIEYIKKNEIADKVFFDNKGKGKAETLDNLKEYLSEARTLNIKCLEKMSEGYFKGKVAGRIQMIDELITVIRILEGE
ncbi:TPA: hypothetical protein K8036_002058 [Staphylococcus pseudintermedius]|nr:hypothetical protein [Staphylococcus pseudintermedius]EGQ4419883.1 hypothetical protein [Staphylococcus pseudintermedius]ELK4159565.1 hypothetical protein [Staphylococcus pseudintermedius]MDK4052578.1 hypothetical protein [Staphylococcus pseudintermedius]MDK4085860.1 hypothetical protein [Staphylococcus pseudintermedius]